VVTVQSTPTPPPAPPSPIRTVDHPPVSLGPFRTPLSLVIVRTRIGDVNDIGLVLGVGDPAECITRLPDRGCHACDSESQDEIDRLDHYLTSIATGTLRSARGAVVFPGASDLRAG